MYDFDMFQCCLLVVVGTRVAVTYDRYLHDMVQLPNMPRVVLVLLQLHDNQLIEQTSMDGTPQLTIGYLLSGESHMHVQEGWFLSLKVCDMGANHACMWDAYVSARDTCQSCETVKII